MEVYPLKILKSILRNRVSLRLSSGKFLPKKLSKSLTKWTNATSWWIELKPLPGRCPNPKNMG
jgi:hypothetical protein